MMEVVQSDNNFTAKCRKLQNYYRESVLKEKPGKGPNRNSEQTYGNYVIGGETKCHNFFNEYTFRYAKQKVLEKHVNPDLTIDEYRLFNNLLSSMPMAFNLFGTLRKILEDNPEEASEVLRQVFPTITWFDKLVFIDIEFIPRPIENYTNDKSAFDVFIKGLDIRGNSGIITIETKYTDLLGTNSSSKKEKKIELLQHFRLMKDSDIEFYQNNGFGQLERNFLLTLAYKAYHQIKHFDHIILSPQEDEKSRKEIRSFTQKLKNYRNQIHKYDLESFVNDAQKSNSNEYRELAKQFYNRYLNFSLIK